MPAWNEPKIAPPASELPNLPSARDLVATSEGPVDQLQRFGLVAFESARR